MEEDMPKSLGKSPSFWTTSSKWKRLNVTKILLKMDFWKTPKKSRSLTEVKSVSVFVVEMLTHKIYHSTKDTVIEWLMSPETNPQRVIKGNRFFMWNVLLPIAEDYSEVAIYELIVKELIIRTTYEGWRLTT